MRNMCVCVCVCDVHKQCTTCQQLQEVSVTAVFQGTHTVFVSQVHEQAHVCALLPYRLSKAGTGFPWQWSHRKVMKYVLNQMIQIVTGNACHSRLTTEIQGTSFSIITAKGETNYSQDEDSVPLCQRSVTLWHSATSYHTALKCQMWLPTDTV